MEKDYIFQIHGQKWQINSFIKCLHFEWQKWEEMYTHRAGQEAPKQEGRSKIIVVEKHIGKFFLN